MMRDRRPRSGGLDWARSPWQLLFLPAAVVIMFWPIITGQRYFFEDIVQQFYPSLSFLAYSLRSFRIPLWSPYVFCGIPYINDIQSQTFYPPNWLFTLFLGSDGRLSFLALELAIISHVLLAGYFMYLLGRELGLTLRPALFAGFCFMLSGFMILRTIHLGVIYTYIWFPLIFLLFRRSLHTGRLLPVLLAGLVFAVAACGGYPQTLLHMSYALGLYALFFIIRHWRQDPRVLLRSVAYLAVMVMVGLGVAAAQYLPSLNYVKYTVRASLSYHDLVDASLRPIQLLTLLAPKFFGSVT
ncbi:MAG: hypothetical protein ABIK62_05405, partial [candidate division WOR-3 bacterium]